MPEIPSSIKKDAVPSVTAQGFKVQILKGAIGGYNSGLLRQSNGDLWLLSRVFEFEPRFRSKLVWQQIDPDTHTLTVLGELRIPGLTETSNAEDARIVRGPDDTIWIVFTEAIYDRPPWKVRMRVARIGPGCSLFEAELKPMIRYGGNGTDNGSEKNWQLFFIGERMFFSYRPYPHSVIEVQPATMEVIGTWDAQTVQNWVWQYGPLSGGTPPIPWRGSLVSFYHGSMPHPTKRRRYFMGAFTFEAKPPFRILEVTPPLLRGSLNDPQSMDPPNHPGLPIVVFPVGLLNDPTIPDRVIVSMGVNDSYDALGEFNLSALPWVSVESLKAPKTFYFATTEPALPPRANQVTFLEWELIDGGGVLATMNPVAIEDCRTRANCREIAEKEYMDLSGRNASVI
jgi:hypothetical protein